ncbi:HAD family hydrolase [Halobacteriovorax sp. HLS]|uniref:HAD family hydrolase n=1 Tax=Halobacteriovorax sp. HLS TaxID=2234000 RepID=UPI000FDC5CF4|nr:HAD-IA family hydrolase [Halobacteriovorax sp. HLS]
MKINAIVFDMDGTIVDSQLDFNQMRDEIGIPKDFPILDFLEDIQDEKLKEKGFAIVEKHELTGASKATPLRDIDSFIQLLMEANFPIGILTRNSKKVTDLTLAKFPWEFNYVLTRDCAPPKPNPEGLFLMAKKFNTPIENLLYIGDYDFDLETARNAGAISGLFLNQRNSHLAKAADLSITNYMDLVSELKLSEL